MIRDRRSQYLQVGPGCLGLTTGLISSFVLVCTGCVGGVPGHALLPAPTARARPASGAAATAALAANDPFETFYAALKGLNAGAPQPGAAIASVGSTGPRVRALLQTEMVQKLADGVHASRWSAEPYRTKIGTSDLKQFVNLLTVSKQELIDELAATDAQPAGVLQSVRRFDQLFFRYLRAYGSGEFVCRDGTSLGRPSLSGGVSDDDIQGLVTVFLEAFYDTWFDMPVFYVGDVNITTTYIPPTDVIGNRVDTTVDVSQALLHQEYCAKYIVSGDGVPTASKFDLAQGGAPQMRVDGGAGRATDLPSLLSKGQAKAILRVSSIAAKQAKSLSGMLFGFLSNVNVSFVLGADFAVGDNKTLLNLVQTLAEVTARRATEYSYYRILTSPAPGVAPAGVGHTEWAGSPTAIRTLKAFAND